MYDYVMCYTMDHNVCSNQLYLLIIYISNDYHFYNRSILYVYNKQYLKMNQLELLRCFIIFCGVVMLVAIIIAIISIKNNKIN